jgi:fibronectin-binding autotransporter adhesin
MSKSIVLAVVAAAASLFVSTAAQATTGTWGGANGNWSSTTGPAGWTNGTAPNAQGDIALDSVGASCTTTQDIAAGVTVGTIKADFTTNNSWQITPNNNVFLDQDGAGPLRASVINNIQSTGATGNPSIFLNPGSGGTFVLQDDLLLSNISNSTRNNGSIQIRGPLKGSGNIYIENVSNNIGAGQIQFTNDESTGLGAGGFAGDIFINKGAVTITRGDVFTPTPGKTVTIGAVGSSDNVTFAFTGGALGNIENGFVAAANTTGAVIFASNPTTSGNVQIKTTNTNAAAIRLDGNLSFDNRATNGSIFIIGDRVTGAGRLTKIGTGPMEITNTNTYSGGTVVAAGSLKVRHADAFDNGFGHHDATDGTLGAGNVAINSNATNPTKLQIDSTVASINAIADTATLTLAGGGTVDVADDGYADLGTGVNERVGALVLGTTAQSNGLTYGSTTSSALIQSDEYFANAGIVQVGLLGDFNGNGTVDAADEVLWSKNQTAFGGAAGYNLWQQNFGNVGGSGLGNQAVPEPATVLMLLAGISLACVGRRQRD